MRKYSEKIHRERLEKMLKMNKVSIRCPAAKYYDGGKSASEMWRTFTSLGRVSGIHPCRICLDFVGIKKQTLSGCPCTILGIEEALKKTYKKLGVTNVR